jgi:hypothetical protein
MNNNIEINFVPFLFFHKLYDKKKDDAKKLIKMMKNILTKNIDDSYYYQYIHLYNSNLIKSYYLSVKNPQIKKYDGELIFGQIFYTGKKMKEKLGFDKKDKIFQLHSFGTIYHGKNLGTLGLQIIFYYMKSLGAICLWLYTNIGNKNANELYKRYMDEMKENKYKKFFREYKFEDFHNKYCEMVIDYYKENKIKTKIPDDITNKKLRKAVFYIKIF